MSMLTNEILSGTISAAGDPLPISDRILNCGNRQAEATSDNAQLTVGSFLYVVGETYVPR